MTKQPHPTDDALAAFSAGSGDATTAETIGQHLKTCSDCRLRLAELAADSGDATAYHNPSATLANYAATDIPPELATHPQYTDVRKLGRGGMGVVYVGKNILMDRYEVLKVLNPAMLEKPGARERFLREIRSAARLQHANVVGAYNAMQAGNLLIFAMEYVPGTDLARLVKDKGPLPVPNACLYIYHAALGLQHAHERGMVHRDIKPGNLILTKEHRKSMVKVLDFGLAKAQSEKANESDLTGEGKMLGTPDYMAPEQSLDATRADIRADIYSLGCTLYAILAGKPPFRGETAFAVIQHHHLSTAPLLSDIRSDVPVNLAQLVARMMAKNPDDRLQNPMEVWKALAEYIKPPTPGTKPAPVLSMPPKPAPRMDWIEDVKKAESSRPKSKLKSKSRSATPKPPHLPPVAQSPRASGMHRSVAPAGEWANTMVEAPGMMPPPVPKAPPPVPVVVPVNKPIEDTPFASLPTAPVSRRPVNWIAIALSLSVVLLAIAAAVAWNMGLFERRGVAKVDPPPNVGSAANPASAVPPKIGSGAKPPASSVSPPKEVPLKDPPKTTNPLRETPNDTKVEPVVPKQIPLPKNIDDVVVKASPPVTNIPAKPPVTTPAIVPPKPVVAVPYTNREVALFEPIEHDWKRDNPLQFSQHRTPSVDSSSFILFGDPNWRNIRISYRAKYTDSRPNSNFAFFAVCGAKQNGRNPEFIEPYLENKFDTTGRTSGDIAFRSYRFPGKTDFGSVSLVSSNNINLLEFASYQVIVQDETITVKVEQLNAKKEKMFYSYRISHKERVTGMIGFKTNNCSAVFADVTVTDSINTAQVLWQAGAPEFTK